MGDWPLPPLEVTEPKRTEDQRRTLVPKGTGAPWQIGTFSPAVTPHWVKETSDEPPRETLVSQASVANEEISI